MSKLAMVKDGHLGGYIHGGDPGTWCPQLWSWVVEEFGIQSVLDVGCGEGHATKFFHDLGCEVLGVDGCQQAIEDSVIPGCVVRHDFCQGPFLTDRSYDMIWSCEFLEHVKPEFVPNVLKTLSRASKVILITHAFPGQEDGHHHVNCRPSSYWIRRIEAVGFQCLVRGTRKSRAVTLADYPGINHFARSGLLFVRTAETRPGDFHIGVGSLVPAQVKSLRINWGFRWSAAYRRQRRERRALKRQARAAVSRQ
jgi:SAM-dependent methyltransferase